MPSDNRTTILHLLNSLDAGGTERVLTEFLRAAGSNRLRHLVVTLRRAGSLAERLPPDVACHALDVAGKSLTSWMKLARVARRHKADVIHARGTGGWMDAILASRACPGTRLVLGFHGFETPTAWTLRKRMVARLGSLAGARFVSVSRSGVTQLMTECGVSATRGDWRPNGVCRERFAPRAEADVAATRARFGLPPNAVVVGTVASLTPIKRLDVLIRAAAILSAGIDRLHLLIVGDGPLRTDLLDLARSVGIGDHVHFAGWQADIADLLQAIDVYVCSSDSEGMSNALLEAMAAARPIVATDVGDNAILLDQGRAGYLIPPASPEKLAAAISELLSRPKNRDELAQAALRQAQGFDFRRTVQAHERYYAALADAPISYSCPPTKAEFAVPGST